MRILEWHIDRFGGLRDGHFSPADGFNLILGDNESGKSTTMAFLRAMFYGIGSSAHSLAEDDRKRLMPWGNASMGGHLVLESMGRTYRIERTFGLSKRFDQTVLRDETTGQPIELPSRQSIGEFLFDVQEQEFMNTVFIGQLASADVTADGGTLAKLTNLATTGDEQVSSREIDTRLRKAMVRLKAERGGGGLIHSQLTVREDLMARRQQILAIESERAELFEQLRLLDRERQQTRVRLAEARKLLASCQDLQISGQSEKAALMARDMARLDDLMKDEEALIAARQADADQLSDIAAVERSLSDQLLTVRHWMADIEEKKRAVAYHKKAVEQLVEQRQLLEESLQRLHSEMGYIEQEALEELEAQEAAGGLESQSAARANSRAQDARHVRRSMLLVLSGGLLMVVSGMLAGYLVDRAAYALVPLGLLAMVGFGLRLRRDRKTRSSLSAMEQIALSQLVQKKQQAIEESRSRRREQHARLEQRETGLTAQLAENDLALGDGQSVLHQHVTDLEEVIQALMKDAALNPVGKIAHPDAADFLEQAEQLLESARARALRLRDQLSSSQSDVAEVLARSGYVSRDALEYDLARSIERLQDLKWELAEKRSGYQALSHGQPAVLVASYGSEARARLYSTFPNAPTDLLKALQEFMRGEAGPDDPVDRQSPDLPESPQPPSSSPAGPLGDEIQPYITLLTSVIETTRDRLANQEMTGAKLESDLKNRFAGIPNLEDIDRSLVLVNERIERMQAEYDALVLARAKLDEAFHSLQQTFGPRLNRRSSEILAALTEGRYQSMRADRSLSVHVELPETGVLQESGFFSGGTIDQIYLALRLSVAELIGSSENRLPLCLDDVFVQYDDRRAQAGLEFLRQYAQEQNLQVLLFTCHQRLALMPGVIPAKLYSD